MDWLLWLALLLGAPLLGGALALVGGRRPWAPWAGWAGATLALIAATALMLGCTGTMCRYHWMAQADWALLGYPMPLAITADWLDTRLSWVVALVAWLVLSFAVDYMQPDPRRHVFWGYLGGFMAAMQGLIWAGNLATVFVAWEVVGLCSFLLISFWYTKAEAFRAGQLAFMLNRLADVALLFGLLGLALHLGQWSWYTDRIATAPPTLPVGPAVLLVLGVAAKSAQGPLLGWLPEAMAGPTPASALLHAATMVAAGVYVLLRVQPMLPPPVLQATAWLGAGTGLWAAWAATRQAQPKRLLAYSTASQLGFMVAAVGLGAPEAAFLHLLVHAFIKAGLFVAVGARFPLGAEAPPRAGLLFRLMVALLLAGLAGAPLTAGFVSKEGILEAAAQRALAGETWALAIWCLLLLAVVGTALYSLRLGTMLWRNPHPEWDDPVEEVVPIRLGPLVVVVAFAVASLPVFVATFSPFSPGDAPLIQAYRAYQMRPVAPTHAHATWPVLLNLAALALGAGLFAWLQRHGSANLGQDRLWGWQWLYTPLGAGTRRLATLSLKLETTVVEAHPMAVARAVDGDAGLAKATQHLEDQHLGQATTTLAQRTQDLAEATNEAEQRLLDPAGQHLQRYLDAEAEPYHPTPRPALAQWLDRLDQSGVGRLVQGTGQLAIRLGDAFSRLQSGRVQGYLLALLVALVLLLWWLVG